MKYLSIDTSGRHLTVVAVNDKLVCETYIEDCALTHSVLLMPKIDEALKKTNLLLSEVDFFGVVLGPGSFTGIRIGVSNIKAFCYAYNKSAVVLTAFDLMITNFKNLEKAICVIDAKNDNFYACKFSNGEKENDGEFINKIELEEISKTHRIISANEIVGFKTIKIKICELLKPATELKKERVNREELNPQYVRKSEAERTLEGGLKI